MKKLLIFALLLALVLALPVAANAQEPVQDSSYIEPEILAQIDMTDADRVVKAFHVDVVDGFCNYEGVETVITNYPAEGDRYTASYYVLSGDSVLREYRMDLQGELVEMERIGGISPETVSEYVYHGGLGRLGDGVEIKAAYLLKSTYFAGNTIYYETNQGVFVYFQPFSWDGSYGYWEFLMPLKDFLRVAEVQRLYHYYTEKDQPLHGGREGLVVDCSGFNIHAEDFDMQFRYKSNPVANAMWIIAFVVGSSALLATHLIKKCRSLRQLEGPRMKPGGIPQYAYCAHVL